MGGRAKLLVAVVGVAVVAALGYLLAPRPRVVFEGAGEFGRVRVLEQRDGLRSLHTGDGSARQSARYPDRPEHLALPYTQVAMVGLTLAPPDAHILFVGLGGGSMPTYARHVLPAAAIDVVEIDPLVAEVARDWFGFREDGRMRVHIGDGREFIERTPPASYDIIFLDAFSAEGIPRALTTAEFLVAVGRTLAAGGIVVSNLWTRAPGYESMLATYAAVFPSAALIAVPGRNQRILVAGAVPLDRTTLTLAARALARRVDTGFDLEALVSRGWAPLPQVDAPLLRDEAVVGSAPAAIPYAAAAARPR